MTGAACGDRVHHPRDHTDKNPEVSRANFRDGLALLPRPEEDHDAHKRHEYAAHLAAGGEFAVHGAGEEENPERGEGVKQGRMAGNRLLQAPEKGVLVQGNEDDAEAKEPHPLAGAEARTRNSPAGEKEETGRRAKRPGQGEGARVRKAHRRLLAKDIGTGGKDDVSDYQGVGGRASHRL